VTAEDRALKVIQLTRLRLEEILRDPEVLVQMAAWDMTSGDLEDTVAGILEYLEKTKEEKASDG